MQGKYRKTRYESEEAFTKGKAKYRNISATSKPKINGLTRPKTEAISGLQKRLFCFVLYYLLRVAAIVPGRQGSKCAWPED